MYKCNNCFYYSPSPMKGDITCGVNPSHGADGADPCTQFEWTAEPLTKPNLLQADEEPEKPGDSPWVSCLKSWAMVLGLALWVGSPAIMGFMMLNSIWGATPAVEHQQHKR